MFTGIIQAMGTVAGIEPTADGVRLAIDPGGWGHRPEPGESIAVSGCCLTIAEAVGADRLWAFDAIPQTLAMTSLGDLKPGDKVNLEHAMRADGLVGGHFVQGHVDGVGDVGGVTTEGEYRIRIALPGPLMAFMAPKGSIGTAGVSMTIADLSPSERWVEIALIPTTLRETTLGALRAGDRINIEADMIAKTVVHHLEHYTPQPKSI